MTRTMPGKTGNRKPKGSGQPNRKNPTKKNESRASRSRDKAPSQRMASQGRQLGMVGAAVLVRQPRIGIPDIQRIKLAWVCGSVYIGNNTLGANDQVYFQSASGTYTIVGPVAIAPGDADIGASYMTSLLKLFRRTRYHKLRACFCAVQSSTTNNLTLTAAPVRGPPGYVETGNGTSHTDATAALTQLNVMSMAGSRTVDSFEDLELDLTKHIAGGSGATQNEFAVAGDPNGSICSSAQHLLGISPSAFVVGGNSTVSSLRGTASHRVVIEAEMDLMDFVGGVPILYPEAVKALTETTEEKRGRLLTELSALAKADALERHRSPSKGKSEI